MVVVHAGEEGKRLPPFEGFFLIPDAVSLLQHVCGCFNMQACCYGGLAWLQLWYYMRAAVVGWFDMVSD
jgi:hypothetical protein